VPIVAVVTVLPLPTLPAFAAAGRCLVAFEEKISEREIKMADRFTRAPKCAHLFS
jgi:hypothetical protein